MDKIRIAFFDDHPLMLDGLAHTLAAASHFIVVGHGGTAVEAVRCAQAEEPDVLLLVVGMPGGGLDIAHRIASTCPAIKIVMLTVSEDLKHVGAALRSGVHGYVLKGISGPELIKIVRTVHDGIVYVSPRIIHIEFAICHNLRQLIDTLAQRRSIIEYSEHITSCAGDLGYFLRRRRRSCRAHAGSANGLTETTIRNRSFRVP